MFSLHHVGADETIKERERNKQKKKERCLANKKIKSWPLANPLAKKKKTYGGRLFEIKTKCIET